MKARFDANWSNGSDNAESTRFAAFSRRFGEAAIAAKEIATRRTSAWILVFAVGMPGSQSASGSQGMHGQEARCMRLSQESNIPSPQRREPGWGLRLWTVRAKSKPTTTRRAESAELGRSSLLKPNGAARPVGPPLSTIAPPPLRCAPLGARASARSSWHGRTHALPFAQSPAAGRGSSFSRGGASSFKLARIPSGDPPPPAAAACASARPIGVFV